MTEKTYVDEYTAVTATLSKYITGLATAEGDTMRPAFHADAVMFTVADGAVTRVPAHNALFDGMDNDFTPSNPTSAVLTVDIVGDVASARVDSDDVDGFRFSDFFHLLKTGSEWQIVAKTFYTHPTPVS